ncbi:unnamed protein product [Diatraea saccharalis]|uniref:RPA43 OB domain-containing protein n=1 Tax=Diatraea saccharalis TaxID=40085 RepID=A0A9N9WCD2_9NEOP|nr:unnamed protein product [Diatraea saccharalis]
MSTIISFNIKELRKLSNDKNSCVVEKKVTQNLALQPWCLGNPKESVKSLLDYKVGKFDKEFNGILLSYKNLRLLQNVGSIRNDNADIHFQVQADYFIFRPYVGATLKGIVNKKSTTHLGILVHRVFNVVIPRPTEEPGSKWIGASIEEGQFVVFRIVVLDLFGALPYIRGELDERCLEQSPDDTEEDVDLNQTINVSYINFDKTKPHLQQQNEDAVADFHKAIKSNTSPKNEMCDVSSDKQLEIMSNSISVNSDKEKPKNKRKSKDPYGETDEVDGRRKLKKHKKIA